MKKRVVDIGVAELAGFGERAAREAAVSAGKKGLSTFGAAEIVHSSGTELHFVNVDPTGEVKVGDRITAPERAIGRRRTTEAPEQPIRRREAVRG